MLFTHAPRGEIIQQYVSFLQIHTHSIPKKKVYLSLIIRTQIIFAYLLLDTNNIQTTAIEGGMMSFPFKRGSEK